MFFFIRMTNLRLLFSVCSGQHLEVAISRQTLQNILLFPIQLLRST